MTDRSPAGIAAVVLALVALAAPNAVAGPPFRTDDPEPVELGHWEIFLFSTATHVLGGTSGILPGIDANYGAAPDLQLHAAMPLAFDMPAAGGAAFGPGDAEIGAKYRILAEDEHGWRPQAAIYPAIDFPTGNQARGLGTGAVHAFLPVWLQKSFGKWTSFAGAGYWLNPGAGNRNYWYLGWAVSRQVADDLTLGGELFHQTANTVDGKGQTGFDLGLTYDLSEHYHLLFSLGEGLQNRSTTNNLSYYAALRFTF